MGFWQGINEGLTYSLEAKARKQERQQELDLRKQDMEIRRQERAEDKAFDREMREKGFQESLRVDALKLVGERRESRRALDAELKLGLSLGLSPVTAASLQGSGQLSLFLEAATKKGVDPSYVTALNTFVEKSVPKEKMSGALMEGVNTQRDTTDPQEAELALMESVLNAGSVPELQELFLKANEPVSAGKTLAPFKLDFTPVAGAEPSETKAIRGELASTLAPYFGDSFTVTDQGETVFNTSNKDNTVTSLFNESERVVRELAYGPNRSMTGTDAANFVSTQIETAINIAGEANAQAMVDDFSLLMTDPVAFGEKYKAAPRPTPVVSPEEVVDDLSNTGTGFGFDVDEEFKKRQ